MTISAPSGVKKLRLPEPREGYDRQAAIFNNVAMEEADRSNFKHFEDVDLANRERLILVDTNGIRWSVTVATSGDLEATAI